ncbi:MAG: hypothetical protein JWO44_185 [Bacteroidetes bacterium]|nr:hypothetical protein [Bacteroidota bacterium]
MEYSYYISSYDGMDTLYRVNKHGKIHENTDTLEAFHEGEWSNDLRYTRSFMNRYMTGWLDEDDAMDYETAIKRLKNE